MAGCDERDCQQGMPDKVDPSPVSMASAHRLVLLRHEESVPVVVHNAPCSSEVDLDRVLGGEPVPEQYTQPELPVLEIHFLGKHDFTVVDMKGGVLMMFHMAWLEPDVVPPSNESIDAQKDLVESLRFENRSVCFRSGSHPVTDRIKEKEFSSTCWYHPGSLCFVSDRSTQNY